MGAFHITTPPPAEVTDLSKDASDASDDDDDDSFDSLPSSSSSSGSSYMTAQEGGDEDDYDDHYHHHRVVAFVEGAEPSAADCQVYELLREVPAAVDPERFPSVARWLSAVSAFPEEERRRWGARGRKMKSLLSVPKLVLPETEDE